MSAYQNQKEILDTRLYDVVQEKIMKEFEDEFIKLQQKENKQLDALLAQAPVKSKDTSLEALKHWVEAVNVWFASLVTWKKSVEKTLHTVEQKVQDSSLSDNKKYKVRTMYT